MTPTQSVSKRKKLLQQQKKREAERLRRIDEGREIKEERVDEVNDRRSRDSEAVLTCTPTSPWGGGGGGGGTCWKFLHIPPHLPSFKNKKINFKLN